jgi:hypothetical protein
MLESPVFYFRTPSDFSPPEVVKGLLDLLLAEPEETLMLLR